MEREGTWGGELEIKVSNDDMNESAGMQASTLGLVALTANACGTTVTSARGGQYPGVRGGNFLIYRVQEGRNEGTHYDFACPAEKLRHPLFGDILICYL